MGLREQKKERSRAAIIENAIALFRERGFEATRVREIADAADVSEATFFNYFPTKDAVLSAWAHAQLQAAFAARAEGGVRSVVRRACADLAHCIEEDRSFAARAWSRARVAAGGAPPDLLALLERAQAEGQLRRDLGSRQLGEIVYAALCATVASWLGHEGPAGSLAPELRRAADLVLDGALRRNERVRPGTRAGLSAIPSS